MHKGRAMFYRAGSNEVAFVSRVEGHTPEKMLRIVQRYTRDGSIINFHDSVKSAERTIEVLPQVIEWLQQQGYKIATL